MLAGGGLLIGLAAGVGVQRVLEAAFPTGGDTRIDVTSLVVVAPLVLAATFVAAYLPARRAARLDPMKALRYEWTTFNLWSDANPRWKALASFQESHRSSRRSA